MENEFHLSIKNTQRKIRDVRDLFCNLTYNEKLCLEKEKVLVEQQLNIIQQQEYYNNNNSNNSNRMSFNSSSFNNKNNKIMQNQNENYNNHDNSDDDDENMDHEDVENRNVAPKSLRKKLSDSDYAGNNVRGDDDGFHDDNNNNSYQLNNNNFSFNDNTHIKPHNDNVVVHSDDTAYERKVKSVYERFNREAVEDFSKYLSDDEDIDATFSRHKDISYATRTPFEPPSPTEVTNEQRGSVTSAKANNENVKEHKKSKSGSFFNSSKKKNKKRAEANEVNTTDMCGLYPLEPSPKDKERVEKQHSKSGLSGIKNKIKNFFTADGTIRDANGNQVSIPPPGFMPERSIQNVDYSSSKIGYSGATYDDYYNQVNELRNFDMEARMKNYKYNPNNKIAIMDESFNLHYSKMNTDSGKAKNINNGNESSSTKSKLFNNKLTSIFTKAKVFNKT